MILLETMRHAELEATLGALERHQLDLLALAVCATPLLVLVVCRHFEQVRCAAAGDVLIHYTVRVVVGAHVHELRANRAAWHRV